MIKWKWRRIDRRAKARQRKRRAGQYKKSWARFRPRASCITGRNKRKRKSKEMEEEEEEGKREIKKGQEGRRKTEQEQEEENKKIEE